MSTVWLHDNMQGCSALGITQSCLMGGIVAPCSTAEYNCLGDGKKQHSTVQCSGGTAHLILAQKIYMTIITDCTCSVSFVLHSDNCIVLLLYCDYAIRQLRIFKQIIKMLPRLY